MSNRLAEPVSRKRPLRRGRSLVHRALYGEQQVGLALHLVQGQPRRATDQVPRSEPSPLMRLRIVEGEVEPVSQEGLGPRERALAGLARAHQHDDREGVEGALQQPGPRIEADSCTSTT